MKLTMSGLDRAKHCPASCVLPQANVDTGYSERGRWRHKFTEILSSNGGDRAAALAEIPEEHREECESIDTSRIPLHLASEVAFRLNVITEEAEEIGRGIERNYPEAQEGDIFGTADHVGVSEDSVCIPDLKGWDYEPIEQNWQLRALAVAARIAYGKRRAEIEIHAMDGEDQHAELDQFAIATFMQELRDLYYRILQIERLYLAGQPIVVTEGTHCRYCPSIGSCPAKTALLVRVDDGSLEAEMDGAMVVGQPNVWADLTEASAPLALRQYQAVDALAKRMKEILEAFASKTPIELGNGKRWGKVEKPGRRRFDGDVFYQVMTELFPEVADKAVTRKATESAIKDALRLVSANGKQAENLRKVMARGEKLGGISQPMSTSFKEYEVAGEIAEAKEDKAA